MAKRQLETEQNLHEERDASTAQTGPQSESVPRIERPFGSANRQRLIAKFLEAKSTSAWQDIYRLLLWIDKTTGLAHCYESDKCQPGKPWYPRSLRFHEWLATTLQTPAATVGEQIDWLFRRTADDYAREKVAQYQTLLRRAGAQWAPFSGRGFPEPGDDPGIAEIIQEVLGPHLREAPSVAQWQELSRRIREWIAVENKRKNLVGEGFEDVICAVVKRFDTTGELTAEARKPLSEVLGFGNLRDGDKENKVDAVVIRKADQHRTLVTAKWSIRADRERQFQSDFGDYVRAMSGNNPFDYVLLTNEFDPARLQRAAESMAGNSRMFATVVHIAPDALRAVYGAQPEARMRVVLGHIDRGRIIGVGDWINGMARAGGAA